MLGSHHTPLVATSLISPIARGSGAARALAMGVKLAIDGRPGRVGHLSKNQNEGRHNDHPLALKLSINK